MAKEDFVSKLKALGIHPQEPDATKVCFEYETPVGRNLGKKVWIGFEVQNDFPMNCPPGPHFKSTIVPGWVDPAAGVNPSPFGSEWRYWSRPFRDWNRTDKTVETYLAHIKNLLATL